MYYDSTAMEEEAVLQAAQRMCAAARTAPKTRGVDFIKTCVLTDEDKNALADEMERLAPQLGYDFFTRDAGNLRNSLAVVLIGTTYQQRGLNEGCGYCNRKNCAEAAQDQSVCAYDNLDLGIAVGSAVGAAADARVDNRVMFSVGRAALSLGILGEGMKVVLAIPLSVSGKSPFFDRK